MDDNYCIKCRHHIRNDAGYECRRFIFRSPVTGEIVAIDCDKARDSMAFCGPIGKYFEPVADQASPKTLREFRYG